MTWDDMRRSVMNDPGLFVAPKYRSGGSVPGALSTMTTAVKDAAMSTKDLTEALKKIDEALKPVATRSSLGGVNIINSPYIPQGSAYVTQDGNIIGGFENIGIDLAEPAPSPYADDDQFGMF